MLKNFNWAEWKASFSSRGASFWVRTSMAVLLIANLIMAYFVFYPVGGTSEEMEEKRQALVTQLRSKHAAFDRSKLISTKVEKGQTDGDEFLDNYFLDRRTTYSTVVGELALMAKNSGIRPKEQAMNEEQIEGSESLSMLTITGNYEGTYPDLLKFVNQIDRYPRLLIIEQLTAAPQAQTGLLSVSIKVNTFIQDSGTMLSQVTPGGKP